MKKIMALAAVGVVAMGLMLVLPATSEARGGHGGHGHGGHGHYGHRSYHRSGFRLFGGTRYYGTGYYYGGRRYYYRNTNWVYQDPCWWTGIPGQWMVHETDPAYFGYYVNGVQVAGYNATTKVYRTYDAATDTWSNPLTPPWGAGNPA